MRVLVASDGDLPVERATAMAVGLAGPDGAIKLVTAVEVPRSVLESLRSVYEQVQRAPQVDTDAEYVSASSLPAAVSPSWPGDDTFIDRYVMDQTTERLGALHTAMTAAGVAVEVAGIESEDPTHTVLDQVAAFEADVLIVGSHGRGRFEGMLGSVGTKLVRRCPISVLVCKA